MKMKVSKEWTEQNNGGNANSKYAIRGFKCNSPGAVAISNLVFSFLFYCCIDFWNKCKKKKKLNVSIKLTEQKNCVNAHNKYSTRVFNGHLSYAVSAVLFLCCCCINFLKISAGKNETEG